jgi:hypothetical protein
MYVVIENVRVNLKKRYRKLYRKGYFFVSAAEKLYYVSIDHPQYVIVDIDNKRVIEFMSYRVLHVPDISHIVGLIESGGEIRDPRVSEVKMYSYEPRKIKACKEA